MAEAPLGLTEEEQAAIWSLIAPVRQNIEKDHSPDGYNYRSQHQIGDTTLLVASASRILPLFV